MCVCLHSILYVLMEYKYNRCNQTITDGERCTNILLFYIDSVYLQHLFSRKASDYVWMYHLFFSVNHKHDK